MNESTQRRRALIAASKNIIGYVPNKAFPANGGYNIITESGFFVTGFIPFQATNGKIHVKVRWGIRYYSYDRHVLVFYDSNKTPFIYWDMNANGYREATTTDATFVANLRYFRMCGVLNDIDSCYLIDAETGITKWRKGM